MATLSVATNRSWTDRDGNEKSDVNWHRVVLWDRLAEVAENYLSTGDRIYLEGRIEYRQWEGEDGRTRHTTEIRGRWLVMLGSNGRPQEQRARARGDRQEEEQGGAPETDFSEESLMGTSDDLPF